MNYRLLLETVVHLKPTQVVYQVLSKVSKPKMKAVAAPVVKQVPRIVAPNPKYQCWNGNEFCFLNIKDKFTSWNRTDHGMLWAYNLNYMDWLNQKGISDEECAKWIDKFIAELPQNHVGQDPYPIALRAINWIKVFCLKPQLRSTDRDNSLYSQVVLLEKKLEYRLLGNHLLEDAYALFIAAVYFGDMRLYKKAEKLLKEQLAEQVLEDGAHYEQSPMYHCILLDRLLDCINVVQGAGLKVKGSSSEEIKETKERLNAYAVKMLGHLESVRWEDGSIPLLNDAAYGIAPTAEQIFDYAKRLGLSWTAIPMKECGYRKLRNKRFEAIVDVGNITASYQPGHTHADTFNYELRIDGKPVIVDTGISTYNKTERRHYERSTRAHNTVSVNGLDSSRVWGGFRVGRRAKVVIQKNDANVVVAEHNGFRKRGFHKRCFLMDEWGLHVTDDITSEEKAVSYIHFAPGVDVSISEENLGEVFVGNHMIEVKGFDKIELEEEIISTTYNQFMDVKVLAITFSHHLEYTIIDEL